MNSLFIRLYHKFACRCLVAKITKKINR